MIDYNTALERRKKAMEWWNKLSLEEKFYKTIPNKRFLGNDASRHPDTLTGREIEMLYNTGTRTNPTN